MKLVPVVLSLGLSLAAALAQNSSQTPLPFVSPIFGDSMVLQRGKPNTIWGWSQPGDTVRVEIGENSATGTAAADGRWQARIQPPPPGGPYTVKITGRQTVELKDVLVGDVWVCSGQSNMAMALRQCDEGEEEAKHAYRFEHLRLCTVGKGANAKPQTTAKIKWRPASNESARDFSGVAYFFASE